MMDFSVVEQDLKETPRGVVYFIFREGKNRKCKIGKSINPLKRVKELQTGNPSKLYLSGTLQGYKRLEKMVHAYFKDQRVRKTEWFNIDIYDVLKIIKAYDTFKKNSKNNIEDTSESCLNSNNGPKCNKEFEADSSTNNISLAQLLEQNKKLMSIVESHILNNQTKK